MKHLCLPQLCYVLPFKGEGMHIDVRAKPGNLKWGLQGNCFVPKESVGNIHAPQLVQCERKENG